MYKNILIFFYNILIFIVNFLWVPPCYINNSGVIPNTIGISRRNTNPGTEIYMKASFWLSLVLACALILPAAITANAADAPEGQSTQQKKASKKAKKGAQETKKEGVKKAPKEGKKAGKKGKKAASDQAPM